MSQDMAPAHRNRDGGRRVVEAAGEVSSAALALLLGPQGGDVLGAALARHGAELTEVRLADVRVQPNGAVRARYAAQVRRADGSRSPEALVAVAGSTLPDGATVLAGTHQGEPVEVGVWRWPQDPALPALRAAEAPSSVAAMLSEFGLPVAGNPELAVRAYRPAQRAVLEFRAGEHRYFLKVVRPAAVGELCVRHDLLSAVLPVPPVLGYRPDGLLVLAQAPGTMLRDGLTGDAGAAPLPAPAALESLLDRLPAELVKLGPVRSVPQRVRGSAEVLRICAAADPAVSAQAAAELSAAANRIVDGLLPGPAQPSSLVAVHGDFYHAQLLTHGARISGLLDVDTAGPGERVDEWATLIGHLSVLGLDHIRAQDYCSAVFGHAAQRVDRGELCRRTAAVVLGLATGPFRNRLGDWVAHTAGRLALARRWLADAAG